MEWFKAYYFILEQANLLQKRSLYPLDWFDIDQIQLI